LDRKINQQIGESIMSLEIAVQENTAALKALANVLIERNILPNTVSKIESEIRVTPQVNQEIAVDVSKNERGSIDQKPQPTYEEVKQAVVALVTAKGREAVVGVLSRFKVTTAKDLAESDWAECISQLMTAAEEY
jgi:hypothetical protein